MRSYQQDKKWSDKFIHQIKHILGFYLIGVASFEDDAERNTDLIVLRMDGIRIACRLRQGFYLAKYANEFTIRYERPSGTKTELAKILEGWGDYLFYGFAANENTLEQWFIGDLNVFRKWFNSEIKRLNGRIPGSKKWNRDESSSFLVYNIMDLPSGFVVGSKPIYDLTMSIYANMGSTRDAKPDGNGRVHIQWQDGIWRCNDCNRACRRESNAWRCAVCGQTRELMQKG